MKKRNNYVYLLLISAAIWVILSLPPRSASADGGGWPTPTPTQTPVPALVITQPLSGQDPLITTQTPVVIEGAAPLPDEPTAGNQILPESGIPAASITSSSFLPDQSNGSSNTRLFITGGVLLIVVLTIGFIVLRLRK